MNENSEKNTGLAKVVQDRISVVENLYQQISSLNEQKLPLNKHSKKWQELFYELCQQTKFIAENQWTHTTVLDAKSKLNTQNSSFLTTESSESILYFKIVEWILNGYNANYQIDGEKKSNHFWRYYISSLMKEVYRHYTKIQIQKYQINKIPDHIQRDINMILAIKKQYNLTDDQNPEVMAEIKREFTARLKNQIQKREAKGGKRWIPKGIDVDNYFDYLLEQNTYAYNGQKTEIYDDEFVYDERINEEKRMEILDSLRYQMEDFQNEFKNLINKKKQEKTAQMNKIIFDSEILTLFLINQILDNLPWVTYEMLQSLFKDLSFTSSKILNQIENKNNLTYKSISLDWNRPENYASKRIKSFKENFLLKFV